MSRPRDEQLKEEIRAGRRGGATVPELMDRFGLSRNTIFYHLREDPMVDGRQKYTREEKLKLARMTLDELRQESVRTGRTVAALQRAAYRTRQQEDPKQKARAKAEISARGYVDFGMNSELQLFGLSDDAVRLANRRLLVYRVKLVAPNRLETLKGEKWIPLSLAFQESIVKDPVETLKKYAEKIKTSWRQR